MLGNVAVGGDASRRNLGHDLPDAFEKGSGGIWTRTHRGYSCGQIRGIGLHGFVVWMPTSIRGPALVSLDSALFA
jgi:hypothetical protein